MGFGPIRRILPITPSTCHERAAQRRDSGRLSAWPGQDMDLKPEAAWVIAENFEVYGVRKVWRQMRRESFTIGRCTVGRLTQAQGLRGVVRGKPVRTIISGKAIPCSPDHVNRQGHAPAPERLAEVIYRREPWWSIKAVKFAALERVDWFNY